MFHTHKWKEIARTYAPNARELGIIKSGGGLTEKMLMGVTTILWKCEKCQQLRHEEMLGKELK